MISLHKKEKAIAFRKQGYSINEIACLFHISKSTASLWLRDIEIDEQAHAILLQKKQNARAKGQRILKEKRDNQQALRIKQTISDLNKIIFNKELFKLLTALFIWTEGMKCCQSQLSFTNSDPSMVAAFLKVLRKGFSIDEKKLRALVHIHEYHDDIEIKKFWSKNTGIPLEQFHKSYLKPHTAKRIKPDYLGCVSIAYYDSQLAREVKVLYNRFSEVLQGAW